jgi:hypothetical protein
MLYQEKSGSPEKTETEIDAQKKPNRNEIKLEHFCCILRRRKKKTFAWTEFSEVMNKNLPFQVKCRPNERALLFG